MNRRRQKGHFLRFGISHPLDWLRLKAAKIEAPNHTQTEPGRTEKKKGKALFYCLESRKEIRGQTIKTSEHNKTQNIKHVAGQAPAGVVIVGIYAFALKNGEAGMNPIPHDLDQAR